MTDYVGGEDKRPKGLFPLDPDGVHIKGMRMKQAITSVRCTAHASCHKRACQACTEVGHDRLQLKEPMLAINVSYFLYFNVPSAA